MLLSPELEIGSTSGRAIVVRAEDMLLILLSITWLAKMAIKKAPVLRTSPLNIPIGIYVAVMCVATVRGMLLGNVVPLKGTFYLLKLIEYLVLYFIVLNETASEKQVKMFLIVLFLTSLAVGIYGNTHIGRVGRISAPFEGSGEPNTLGGYLLFIMSIIAGLIVYYKKRRWPLICLFVFLLPTFLFTYSRASFLGVIFSMFVFTFLTKDKRVIIWILAIILAFFMAINYGPPMLKKRVLGTFIPEENQAVKKVGPIYLGPSPAARVQSWEFAFRKQLPRKPLLGYGITGAGFLDSQYVLTLVETGVLGLLAFLWLMWRVWIAALRSYKTVENPLYKGLAMGFMVGFAGLLAHAIGSNTWVIIRIAEPFWFFTAIVVKLVDVESGKAKLEDYVPR